MKKFLSKYYQWLLTLAFGLAVFLFWRYRYPFALTYQEQFQLFLFDDDYFLSRMAEPGGLARYVAEFLVQFYNSVTFGALILALIFMLIQRLTWRLMGNAQWYTLSFVPAILLWYAMGDESVLLTYAVALALGLLASWLTAAGIQRWVPMSKRVLARMLILLVLIPLLYWMIGPMVILVALCVMPVSVVYALAVMLLSAHFLPYPLLRVMLGISYYRFPETMPYLLMAMPVIIWLLRLLSGLVKLKKAVWPVCLAVVLVLGFVLIPRGFNAKKYELIEYDYLVRIKDWNAVIAKAERQTPDLPMSVSATNLALAMTNQLGERAFDFYQRGSEGLLPKFERNFTTAQLTGEIYFHLGLINTAQRFAFESMEALPNYNKSARVIKRLAETNLINGQYAVARKYLQMLEKTIFYRPWAQRTMAMLGDEKAINAHPLYGTLRQYRLEEDFLFSEDEIDKICGQLFMHCPQNQMATQYLVMAPLMDRDVPRFMQYVQVVQNRTHYNPRHCQEGIAFAFMQQRQQLPQGVVSPMMLQQMNDFTRIYANNKNSPDLGRFRNTAWYYLMVGK